MRHFLIAFIAMAAVVAEGAAAQAPGGAGTGAPAVVVLRDFVTDFEQGAVTNASAASASGQERSGGVALPGIFLHPGSAEDAVLAFKKVAVPPQNGFLLFRIGIREGVPWGAETNTPNGVRFLVAVNGKIAFQEDVTSDGWRSRAVSLSPWAGRRTTIEFRTNAIDGLSNYDWSSFGGPRLVRVDAAEDYRSLPPDSVGVAIAEIRCAEPATVTVTMGPDTENASLVPGDHIIPLHFSHVEEVALQVHSGAAQLMGVLAAPFLPQVETVETALSTPLITAGRQFAVLRKVKNVGLGAYLGDAVLGLAVRDRMRLTRRISNDAIRYPLGKLGPNEEKTFKWENLVVPETGDWLVSGGTPRSAQANAPFASGTPRSAQANAPFAGGTPRSAQANAPFAGDQSLLFHAFPPEPETSAGHMDAPNILLTPGAPIRAAISNAWGRLSFVQDAGSDAYAIAETWNGAAWQRVGSLYPLARVVVRDPQGLRRELPVRIQQFDAADNRLVAVGYADAGRGVLWPVCMAFVANASPLPIQMIVEVTAADESDLLAFYGPSVLAGDRAYGADKDFAIFPGVEYLEGAEPSSSQRDLAYPLSDRRVPASYKITTPLMAVQADGGLLALLWDPDCVWTGGQRRLAARFQAPEADSGFQHIKMSLFAPAVGEYVPENHYEATTPCPLRLGQRLRIESWLVLDHKARYGPDSVVQGPHEGALVLQAMRHWFDLFGIPAPSDEPRDWEAEKDLCRDAYLNAVWSDEPPGWRHCAGWAPGLLVGHAVPLLMEVREGLPEDVRDEVLGRIKRVCDRALVEQGPHYLWTNAGCHIVMGELPFYYGYVPESLANFKRSGLAQIAARENGLWVWRPAGEKYGALGVPGDHTLGQASYPSMQALRAARMTGDPELTTQALDAMKQMGRYEVPRGAQTWECPLYQPDILAAGQAVRAYCEAYRITGDPADLAQARYWAWTGLPFIYMWDIEGYPTMRYNVISVLGSTFFTHSWLGLPVVWCGLVYAYGLEELAEFDGSFPWRVVAQGITNSAVQQQYSDGPSKGCYPDSWNMIRNTPNPADINPENILMNECRLRGASPEIRSAPIPGGPGARSRGERAMLNSAADIVDPEGSVNEKSVRFSLKSAAGFAVHTVLAPVPEPASVTGAGQRIGDSPALMDVPDGWLYDAELRAVVLKTTMKDEPSPCEVKWR